MKLVKYISILILFLVYHPTFSQKKWTLQECIDYAKEHNIDVVKQRIRNQILKKDITIARGNYLPNASFNASQNFSLGNSFNVSTGVGQRESRSNSFSLSSSTTIFNGFSNKYKLERSKLVVDKGKADIDKIRFDLSLNITNKYLQVLFNKEVLKIANEQVKISQDNFDRLSNLFKNALTTKRELLEIESTLASDKKEVIIAQNKVEVSLIELKELLDIKEIENFNIQDIDIKNVESLQNSSNLITDKIISQNPEIKASLVMIEIKKKDIKLAKASFYPTLSFNYSYSSNYFHVQGEKDQILNQQTKQYVDNGFWTQLNNNRTHYLGFSATIPIFNRFLTRESYKKSKEELNISEIELESIKTKLKNKIKIAQNDLETAKATLKASKIAFESQQEAFFIAQEKYKRGNIANYEFLESKSKLIKTKSEYIKSKYEVLFKEKLLRYYFIK